MTDERLEEIEKRVNAATEAPWHTDNRHVWVDIGSQECCGCPIQETDDGIRVTGEYCCGQPEVTWQQAEIAQAGETDAVFIAHAREDIPWLIAQLRAAQATGGEWNAAIEAAANCMMRLQAKACSVPAADDIAIFRSECFAAIRALARPAPQAKEGAPTAPGGE